MLIGNVIVYVSGFIATLAIVVGGVWKLSQYLSKIEQNTAILALTVAEHTNDIKIIKGDVKKMQRDATKEIRKQITERHRVQDKDEVDRELDDSTP